MRVFFIRSAHEQMQLHINGTSVVMLASNGVNMVQHSYNFADQTAMNEELNKLELLAALNGFSKIGVQDD